MAEFIQIGIGGFLAGTIYRPRRTGLFAHIQGDGDR